MFFFIIFYRYGATLNIIGNEDLEFLGFASLKTISAGHVIIESNRKLCYLEGIKWSKLYKGTIKQAQFIRTNANNSLYCSK